MRGGGGVLQNPEPPLSTALKVMTLNLWHDMAGMLSLVPSPSPFEVLKRKKAWQGTRLHEAIVGETETTFCAITCVPCIVMSSYTNTVPIMQWSRKMFDIGGGRIFSVTYT